MDIGTFSKNQDFDNKKPKVELILETHFSKEIRILLASGVEMKEHKSASPIVIQILAGEIEFCTPYGIEVFNQGDILSLKGNVPHSLLAMSDSVVRLTLPKSDSISRVINASLL